MEGLAQDMDMSGGTWQEGQEGQEGREHEPPRPDDAAASVQDASSVLWDFVDAFATAPGEAILVKPEYLWFQHRVDARFKMREAAVAAAAPPPCPDGVFDLPHGVTWDAQDRSWHFTDVNTLFHGVYALVARSAASSDQCMQHATRMRACLRSIQFEMQVAELAGEDGDGDGDRGADGDSLFARMHISSPR